MHLCFTFLKSSLRQPPPQHAAYKHSLRATPIIPKGPPWTNSTFNPPALTKATVTMHARRIYAKYVTIAKASPRQLAALHMQKCNEDCIFHLQLQRCTRPLNENDKTQQFSLYIFNSDKRLSRLCAWFSRALFFPPSGALGCLNPFWIAPFKPSRRRNTLR